MVTRLGESLQVGGRRLHRGRLLVGFGARTPTERPKRQGDWSRGRRWQSWDRPSLADQSRRCGGRSQRTGRDGLVDIIVATTFAAESVAGSAKIKLDTPEALEHDHGDDPEAEERPSAHCDPEIDGDRAAVWGVQRNFGRGPLAAARRLCALLLPAVARRPDEQADELIEVHRSVSMFNDFVVF